MEVIHFSFHVYSPDVNWKTMLGYLTIYLFHSSSTSTRSESVAIDVLQCNGSIATGWWTSLWMFSRTSPLSRFSEIVERVQVWVYIENVLSASDFITGSTHTILKRVYMYGLKSLSHYIIVETAVCGTLSVSLLHFT